MGLAQTIRGAVALAAAAAGDVFSDVEWEEFLGTYDGDGKKQYAAAVTLSGFLDSKTTSLTRLIGPEIVGASTFLICANVDAKNEDRFTLPDGSQPPVLDVGGPADPAGGRFITTIVFDKAERSGS